MTVKLFTHTWINLHYQCLNPYFYMSHEIMKLLPTSQQSANKQPDTCINKISLFTSLYFTCQKSSFE